jgi:DNA (cytosine-5)-methyltransferase 1
MKYVDLFAGCGGLSLGFERAGFELLLAVEKSEMATETLSHNLVQPIADSKEWKDYVRNSTLEEQFKNKIITKELRELLDSEELMQKIINAKVDMVVGGPPCQGFSMAGRRNPNDVRNILPWQFLEFVERVNPKAVVIENVVGMSRNFKDKEAPFNQLQEALRTTGKGYVVQPVHVNAMHYGVPEHRPRLMILGLRSDLATKLKIENRVELWNSNFSDLIGEIADLAPEPTVSKRDMRTVRDAIADLSKIPDSQQTASGKKFLKEMKDSAAWKLRSLQKSVVLNNSARNHQPKARQRFELYQYLRDQDLASKILNIPAMYEKPAATAQLEVLLSACKFPARLSNGKVIAKNKSELIDLMFELKTKKHSQRPLHWDKPSPTVVTLPDDYVHPDEPRIFTVRELARFQSFPDAFEFKSKETTGSDRRRTEVPQYSQVGNAVAPLLAYAVAKKFYSILSLKHAPVDGNRARKAQATLL